jgi:tyrosine-protein kinase Etk/Wzc
LFAFFATFAPLLPKKWQIDHISKQNIMNNRDNLLGVIGTIYRWRKALRNVTLIALIGSAAFALWLPNYYQSTTVFYPASTEIAKPEVIFGSSSKVTEYFGTDRDLDRLLEIANSNEIVDFLVSRFGLYQHYGIDSSSHEGLFRVRERFRGLYVVQKNKNDALELSIEDTNPQLAADMANAARDKINELSQRLVKKTQAILLTSFEDNIQRKLVELKVLADSLRFLQAHYNLYNIVEQGEVITNELATASTEITRSKARLEVLSNNPLIPKDTIEYIKANLRAHERTLQLLNSNKTGSDNFSANNYNQGLPLVNVMTDLHYQARRQLSYDLERFNQIKAAYNTNIPALQVLSPAETPIMKSRPKRSMMVVGATIAAFLFTLLAALLADAYRDVNWKQVIE